MKKEDILKISRLENKNMDEREHKIDDDSIYFGMIGVFALTFFFLLFKLFKHQPYTDMLSILTINLTVASFYKYKRIPNKKFYLFSGIIGAFITVGFITTYLIEVF